jgi:hypothetical protein
MPLLSSLLASAVDLRNTSSASKKKKNRKTLKAEGARQVKREIALEERIYLAVPYDERNEAKALGARWDAVKKCGMSDRRWIR